MAPPVSGGWRPAPRLHGALDQGPWKGPPTWTLTRRTFPRKRERSQARMPWLQRPQWVLGGALGSERPFSVVPSSRQGTQHQPGTGHGRHDEGPWARARGLLRVLTPISHVGLFVTAWTAAHQARPSRRFSRHKSGVGGHAPSRGLPGGWFQEAVASQADTLVVSAWSWSRAWVGTVAPVPFTRLPFRGLLGPGTPPWVTGPDAATTGRVPSNTETELKPVAGAARPESQPGWGLVVGTVGETLGN